MMMVLLLLAGLGVVNWQQAPSAVACSCALLSPAEYAANADLVAEGTIIGVDRPENAESSAADVTYSVEVARLWKGPDDPQVAVLSPISGASCGLENVAEGMLIALYANDDNGTWRSISCDGTGPADDDIAAQLTTALGEPTTLTPAAETSTAPSPTTEPGNPVLLYAALGVSATALAALLILGWVRRSRA